MRIAMEQSDVFEIPLPSGVTFPDWSVIKSDKARASLLDTLGKLRMAARWNGMTEREGRVHRAILMLYVETGQAPKPGAISERTAIQTSDIPDIILSLKQRDLIVVSHPDLKIETAYPFTKRNTEHQVILGTITLKAMCAIDALGAGAMLSQNTLIISKCRHCSCDINIETRNKGRVIASVSPKTAIVWSGVQNIDGCAADTQCSVMAYFCSDKHLKNWQDERSGEVRGHRLTIEQGLEAGAAIFIPFLAVKNQHSTN